MKYVASVESKEKAITITFFDGDAWSISLLPFGGDQLKKESDEDARKITLELNSIANEIALFMNRALVEQFEIFKSLMIKKIVGLKIIDSHKLQND